MIHPSYVELMKIVNEGAAVGEEPVVNSRYSIVTAVAHRARQLTAGKSDPMVEVTEEQREKAILVAVKELEEGKLKILTPEEAEEARLSMEEELEERRRIREAIRLARQEEEEARRAEEEEGAEILSFPTQETHAEEVYEDAADAEADEEVDEFAEDQTGDVKDVSGEAQDDPS